MTSTGSQEPRREPGATETCEHEWYVRHAISYGDNDLLAECDKCGEQREMEWQPEMVICKRSHRVAHLEWKIIRSSTHE